MKKIVCLLPLLISFFSFAQKKYAQEFSILNDNDLYTSISQDRYYTNGLFLSYRYLSKQPIEHLEKRIYEFQLGHQMYSPFKATVYSLAEHDRPFAAYLYGSFAIQQFYKTDEILKIGAQIGVIGPAAYGRELQDFIHDIYGFKRANGWDYQIANAFALNFNAQYVKPLIKDQRFNNDISWVSKANAGTVFTDIATGVYARIGLKPLQRLANSIAFHGNLNNEQTQFTREAEVFLYVQPMVSYVLYDATIQGSFLNTGSPLTYLVMPFKFTLDAGIRFSVGRVNIGYSIHYHTKKLKSIRVPRGNIYGSLQINYLFN